MFRPLVGSKRGDEDESGQPKALKWFTLVLLIFRVGNPEKYFAKKRIPSIKEICWDRNYVLAAFGKNNECPEKFLCLSIPIN
jgi:hypothetical protein